MLDISKMYRSENNSAVCDATPLIPDNVFSCHSLASHMCRPVKQRGSTLFHRSDNKGSFSIAVIALIVVLILILAFAAVMFLPVRSVNFDQSKSVSLVSGVNKLDLKLSLSMGEVRVSYANLSGQALNLHVVVKGSVGLLMDTNTVSLNFVQTTSTDTALVNASLNLKDRLLGAANMNVRCNVIIDNSMRSKLDLTTSAGSIIVNSTNATSFDQMDLNAKAGAVRLIVAPNVSLNGNISLSSGLGASVLDWKDPLVMHNISVVTSTKAGGVVLNLSQTVPMNKTVSLSGTAQVGGVVLTLGMQGDIGASINSSSKLGGVHVGSKVGFTGGDNELRSTNYPAAGNFSMILRANVGGVEIKALSAPSGL
jgi:hypothetical protein